MSNDASPATEGWKSAPPFLAGMVFGTALFVFIDVQVSLAAIDPADPGSWPQMSPRIRYGFLPLWMLLSLGFAGIADAVVRRLTHPARLTSGWQRAALGFCYAAVTAVPLMTRFVGQAALLLAPVLALLLAWFVRRRHAS